MSIITREGITVEDCLWDADFPLRVPQKKLSTCSSTETELVGADDFMPEICCNRFFLRAQGYRVLENVLFQDNRSSIFPEKNGKD